MEDNKNTPWVESMAQVGEVAVFLQLKEWRLASTLICFLPTDPSDGEGKVASFSQFRCCVLVLHVFIGET